MNQFETDVICLKASPFEETSLVVVFYSPLYGELRGIIKGAKKPTSKLVGASEAFTLNYVSFAKGRNLHIVSHYDRLHSFSHLRSDLERLAVASVCTEVLRRLGHESDPDSHEMYALLSNLLTDLDDLAQPWYQPSIRFHRDILSVAGYVPTFAHCSKCDSPLDLDSVSHYSFYPLQGGFFCKDCRRHIKDMRWVNVSTKTLQLFVEPDTLSSRASVVKAHRFLAYYWQQRVEMPLKSFDFLFQLLETTTPCPA